MTVWTGDNIISALGFTAEENYRQVKQGISGLKRFAGRYGLPESFMASEIDDARLHGAFECLSAAHGRQPAYTKLEQAAIVSVAGALKGSGIDPSDRRTLFVLSTTKGNIFLLDDIRRTGGEQDQLYLWRSAELIARFFGNANRPLVVSNACISGASAMIAAQRALRSGRYAHVVVTGADVLSEFIVTGFQSFKALSQDVCKPFDANRAGLNLGEAAATVIMTERPDEAVGRGEVAFTTGAVRNDANHISGPSRTGEGAYRALRRVMEGTTPEEIAFVCAHGTATPYNDDMEAAALTRAGLQQTPVNSLKGYYGHTLGAAGVMESILSVRALKEGLALKTCGLENPGVAYPLNPVTANAATTGRRCIKMLSGFGGCNAAVLFTKITGGV